MEPPAGAPGHVDRALGRLGLGSDPMDRLREPMLRTVLAMDLAGYDAILSWSPFHSVNPMMVQVKRAHPELPWIAQFSDPWAGNPLETSFLTRLWHRWHEPATVAGADGEGVESPKSFAVGAEFEGVVMIVLPSSNDAIGRGDDARGPAGHRAAEATPS